MDRSRLASFQSLPILSCGDVEKNPRPPKKGACKSEVIRQFMRCIQSELVKLVYNAKKQDLPKLLYKKNPPGWDAFETDTEFKNICNAKKEANKTFDKLVKLCRREVPSIPKDIFDVIVCYEKLRDSKKDSDETKSWKIALENYVSKNKSMKNKSTIIDHIDEKLLIKVIQKGTEGVNQGIIGSSLDAFRDIFSALNGFIDAAEKNLEQMLKKPITAGKKRSSTAEHQDAMSMIEQVKKKTKLLDCEYAYAETTENGCKPKPERNSAIKGKHHKAMVTQESCLQLLDTYMQIVPPSLQHTEPPHIEPQQMGPQLIEPQQFEPGQFEPQQFEPRWMESQQFGPQQMEPQQLPSPPSPPCCDGILDSEDFDLQGKPTRRIPIVQETSDCTLSIQEDCTDCLSESSLEDEALKNMPFKEFWNIYG